MGKPKHTPGPWTAICDDNFKRVTKHDGHTRMALISTSATDERVIAIDCTSSGADYDEDCANAALIASAPEMYAALEDAIKLLEHHVRPEWEQTKFRRVLAKARGETGGGE